MNKFNLEFNDVFPSFLLHWQRHITDFPVFSTGPALRRCKALIKRQTDLLKFTTKRRHSRHSIIAQTETKFYVHTY
jgi:hypothetical protein